MARLGTDTSVRANFRKRSKAGSASNSTSSNFDSAFGFTPQPYHAGACLSTAYAGKGGAVDAVLPVSSLYVTRRPVTALAT